MAIATPWAILLTRFKDNLAEPLSRDRYEELFTSAGSGKWNMVDFFHDVSHGQLDLNGSQVFGWHTLDKDLADYTGGGGNPAGRSALITWARDAATKAGVDLSRFYSVVVCLNVQRDLFGGASGAVAGHDGTNNYISGLAPSLLGQEMGHVYGLDHSRLQGSLNDYTDPFDIMSTQTDFMADNPIHQERDPRGNAVFPIGPGLNAANMAGRGWLDTNRVWQSVSSTPSATVTLRPLHRRDLPGYLAVQVGDYFIEFRMNEGWDAAMQPCVLVHTLDGNISYLVPDDAGNVTWGVGSKIQTPPELSVFGSGALIMVNGIDTVNRTANVTFAFSKARIPQLIDPWGPFRTPWIKWQDQLGGLEVGRGPDVLGRGPAVLGGNGASILQNLVLLQETPAAQIALRRQALAEIAALATDELARMDAPGGVSAPDLANGLIVDGDG